MNREQFNEKYAWAYDAMREGKKCKFWDDDEDLFFVGTIITISYNENLFPFGRSESNIMYENCELVKTEKWIKEPKEAMRLLFENGYKFVEGGYIIDASNLQGLAPGMIKFLGTKLEGDSSCYIWPDFLIEEREV